MHDFRVGDRVWWTDPADDACSGAGTIQHVQHEEDDAVISIIKDDKGVVEALPRELVKLKKVLVVQGALLRVEWSGVVEVPEDADESDVVQAIYDEVDGDAYYPDNDFWERGEGSIHRPPVVSAPPVYRIGKDRYGSLSIEHVGPPEDTEKSDEAS
jgi:hypothetical protein